MTLNDIPDLKQFPNDGRVIPIATLYDGQNWHTYRQLADQTLFDLKSLNMVSGVYIAATPAGHDDLELPLLTFLFQHYPSSRLFQQFELLHSDLQNALAVIHKYFILLKHFTTADDLTYSQTLATEIEYALLNHRSGYDLLHSVLRAFIAERGFTKKDIPDSFAKLAEKPLDERTKKWDLPEPVAIFVETRKQDFLAFRRIRDLLNHHGHSPDMVLITPAGFAIAPGNKFAEELKAAGMWESLKPRENDLASCLAFLATVANDLFTAVDGLQQALRASANSLPSETAPGYRIFIRSPLLVHYASLRQYLDKPWEAESPLPPVYIAVTQPHSVDQPSFTARAKACVRSLLNSIFRRRS